MKTIEEFDLAKELKEKINLLTKKINEGDINEIKRNIYSKIEYAKQNDIIWNLGRFYNDFEGYGIEFDTKMLEHVFKINLKPEAFSYINKEEIYFKLINVIKEIIEEDVEENVLSMLLEKSHSELILEKEKTKYLVNRGSLEKTTIFNKEKVDEMKNKLISLFEITLKYELKMMEKEEFKINSSNIYFNILRFENIIMTGNLEKFSEEYINNLSGTKANAEKIKKEIKKWLLPQKELISLEEMENVCVSLEKELKDFIYLFDESELLNFQISCLKDLDYEIENLMDYDEKYHETVKSILKQASERYEEIMKLSNKKDII